MNISDFFHGDQKAGIVRVANFKEFARSAIHDLGTNSFETTDTVIEVNYVITGTDLTHVGNCHTFVQFPMHRTTAIPTEDLPISDNIKLCSWKNEPFVKVSNRYCHGRRAGKRARRKKPEKLASISVFNIIGWTGWIGNNTGRETVFTQ
jgi:hypothetical protein